MRSSQNKKFSCFFSLVELLVVIAIMFVLITVLVPALGRTMQMARMVACSNQLRQIALAYNYYYNDNKIFPAPYFFLEDFRPIAPYIQSYHQQIFRCPSSQTIIPSSMDEWLVNTDYLYSPGNLRDMEIKSATNDGFGNNPYNFDPSNKSTVTTLIINSKLKNNVVYDRNFPAHLKFINVVYINDMHYQKQFGVSSLWVLDDKNFIIRSLSPYPTTTGSSGGASGK